MTLPQRSQHLVVSDDLVVEDLLLGTLDLVREGGGWVAPGTRLIAERGHLRINSEATSGPLLRIPVHLWVRVDRVTWGFTDERLEVVDVPDDIGEFELPMLYLQTALHNACGKLDWLSVTHPSLASDVPDPIIVATRALIPSFRAHPPDAVDVLFADRCFRIPAAPGGTPQRMLIPLVDLLNHHTSGAAGSWDGNAFCVEARQPFDSDECALDYGLRRDAMEMAVVYGFIDTSATLAHSAPVVVDMSGGTRLQVMGDARDTDGSLVPINAIANGDVMSVNRLTFSSDDPDSTVHELAAATGWDAPHARVAVAAIARANISLVDALIKACADAPDIRAAAILGEAARVQRSVVEVLA